MNIHSRYLLFLVFFIAFIPRILYLGDFPPVFYDEGSLVQIGTFIHHGIFILPFYGNNMYPPLAPLISSLLPVSLFWQRLPDVFLGSFSCVVVFLLVKKYNVKLAFLSSILLTFSPTIFGNRTTELTNGTELFFLLTIYLFVCYKDSKIERYLLLSGICAGISFLYNYLGAASILFILFETVIFRLPIRKISIWWLSAAFTTSLFFVYNFFTDGSYLFQDLILYLTPSSSTTVSPSFVSKLGYMFRQLVFGYPIGFLVPSNISILFKLFIFVGFVSTILVLYLKRNTLTKDFLLASFLAVAFSFYLGSGSFFWVFFLLLIPLYSICIITLLFEKNFIKYLGVILLFFTLVSLGSFYGTVVYNTNTSFYQTVSWLSSQHGLIAADPAVGAFLPYNTSVNILLVIFWNHPYNYHEWSISYAPRLHGNLSLSLFTYAVIDNNILSVADGSPTVASYITYISTTWHLVHSFGQYNIYENPTVSS